MVPLKDNPYKALKDEREERSEVSDTIYSSYPTKRVKRDMHGIYLWLVA